MQRPSTPAASEVAALLREAIDRGQPVLVLSTADWLAGADAPVDRTLTAPPLRTSTSLVAVCCQAFKLTLAESRLFVALLKYDQASRKELHAALSPGGDPTTDIKVVGVIVHWLRKKLAPHGIAVVNTYGVGYRLGGGARDRTRELLAAYGADIVDAVTPVD